MRRFRRSALITAVIALLASVVSAQVTIDDLVTAQGPEAAAAPGSSASTVAEGANTIVGGFRDLVLDRGTGSGSASVEVTASTVVFSSDAGADATASLGYDANTDASASTLDPNGLPSTDLTAGGHDALLLTVEAAAGGPTLGIQVWSGADVTSSSFSIGLPDLAAATPYAIPYTLFSQSAGATAAANFAAVTAILITLEGNGVSATLSGPIQTGVATPQISVTKVDLDDFSSAGGTEIGGGFVNPGDSLTYQITVRNTGAAGTTVTVADMLDANLMQTLPEDVRITPLAFPDVYDDHCGNTRLMADGAAGFEGLLANDLDLDDSPAGNTNLTLTMVQGMAVPGGPYATDQGGSVTNVNAATGTFDYAPPVGFTGSDTFVYTVTDDEGQTGTGQATIVVSDLIWFVDNNHGGANAGTLDDPFQTLAAVNGAGGAGDPDLEAHRIFIFENGGGAYTGGIELETGQHLIGEAAGLADCVRTAIPAGGRPVIENAGGHGVQVAVDNTVRGLDLGATPAGSAALASAANVGTLTVTDTVISGTGRAISLTGGGTLAATFNSIASTSSSGGAAIALDGMGGSLVVTTGAGLETSIASSTAGVDVRNSVAAASFSFGDTTIGTSGVGVTANANGTATVTFADLDVTSTGGSGVVGATSGSLVVTDPASVVSVTGGPALDLQFIDLGAGLVLTSASSSGSGRGIHVVNINDPITINGGSITKANADHAVEINAGSANFTYAGTVSQNGSGRTVRVNGRVGGIHTFSGNVSGAMGGGVELSANLGAQIDFTGGLDLQTGNNIAFRAILGGTVNVTSAGVTNLAVNGALHALDLDTITIGASDITFDTITATSPTDDAVDIDSVTNAGSFFGGAVTINGGFGVGIDINGSSATFGFTSATIDNTVSHGVNLVGANGSVTFGTVDIDGTTASGIRVDNNTNPVTVSGGTIGSTSDAGNAANAAVRVVGGTGNVTVDAAVTNSTGRAVEVTGRGGGVVDLGGFVDENALGLLADNNDQGGTGTVRYTGGMALDTGANTAFAATNGGVIEVCDAVDCAGGVAVANTIGAGTALTKTAVNINSTTIGANGVNFRSISGDQSATAPDVSVIRLTNSGAGPFHVTGVNGPCGNTPMALDCDGGRIAGITGTDANVVDAIRLENTGGRVTLENMLIEDIKHDDDTGDVIQTLTGVDAIHGQMVAGGLTLDNTTIRRTSDNAINGSVFSDGISPTTWTGLDIVDSHIEQSNRFDVPARGDDADEGAIRIAGLTGTVTMIGTRINDVARALDTFTPTGNGTLDVTIQSNIITRVWKEFAAGGTINVGGRAISIGVEGTHDAVVRVGDPAEVNPALGNTIEDGGTASVVVFGQEGAAAPHVPHTGDIDVVISRNIFRVVDHTTAQAPPGNFLFNFPQGGVSLNPNAGTYDAIVSHNLFDEVMHAAGGFGQLTLGLNGGAVQAHVHNNNFMLPWDAAVVVRAEDITSGAVLFENNTYTDGLVGGPGDDVGFATQSPFQGFLLNVLNGGQLDMTIKDEVLPLHDNAFSPTKETLEVEVQNQAGNFLNLWVTNTTAPWGYGLIRTNGTFNLHHQGGPGSCAGPPTPQAILQANGNTGGGSNPATNPPTVVLTGTVGCTETQPTQPSITIP